MQTIQLPSGQLQLAHEETSDFRLEDLCGFASRQNPKRGFLFVSKVLGKHVPANPDVMAATHARLANLLRPLLAQAGSALFLGFAETATGLGHGVYDACLRLGLLDQKPSLYVQTTRYSFHAPVALHFQEEHSHATGHLVHEPRVGGAVFFKSDTLVLVDDELTTGKTCLNFLREFLAVNPNIKRVALVSLLNWMPAAKRQAFQEAFPSLDVCFAALVHGDMLYSQSPDFVCPPLPAVVGNGQDKTGVVPIQVARFGQQGLMRLDGVKAAKAVLSLGLKPHSTIRIIGDGEFMHVPHLLGRFLTKHAPQLGLGTPAVTVQSTTRSPILVGGAIQAMVRFEDHYSDGIQNYLYNPPADTDMTVLVHEAAAPIGLQSALPNLKQIFAGDLL